MARAKRTDRAEARRRYRASQAAEDATDDSSLDNAGVADGSPARSSTERTAPAARPGLLGAFTGSIRRPDLREDLGYLPELIRNKAVWAPSLLTIAAGAAVFVPGVLASPLSIVIPLFVLQAPMAGPFLAGIWAPRASWLAGLIVGLISAVISSLYVLVVPVTGVAITAAQRRDFAINYLVVFPIFSAFVASFAAFYRRFLRVSNQSAARRAQERARHGGSQRSAERPSQRPATARRR